MSSEICRHPVALNNFLRLRSQERSAIAEQRIWEGREIPIFDSGEPISRGRVDFASQDVEGHGLPVVEAASRKDVLLRQAEQIDRARRMIEIGKRLTPQWIKYTLKAAPELFVTGQLQKSA